MAVDTVLLLVWLGRVSRRAVEPAGFRAPGGAGTKNRGTVSRSGRAAARSKTCTSPARARFDSTFMRFSPLLRRGRVANGPTVGRGAQRDLSGASAGLSRARDARRAT